MKARLLSVAEGHHVAAQISCLLGCFPASIHLHDVPRALAEPPSRLAVGRFKRPCIRSMTMPTHPQPKSITVLMFFSTVPI